MKHTAATIGALFAGLLTFTEAAASECDDPATAWLMCEDFEGGGQGWTSWFDQSQWTECDGCPDGVNNPDRIRLEQDADVAHDGEWSLTTPGTSANYTGGTLRWASCAGEQNGGCQLEGYDRLYFRTWVRLAADHDYVHHFLGIGGSRPDGYWDANGNAGCRPNGERWAGTRVDLNSNHELFFYTYFPGMNCDSGGYCSGQYADDICAGCATKDMPCSNGPECCWGNHFSPEPAVVMQTETWTCIEMMMELNTPGQSDGSMAFWVDDELGQQTDGMAWRDIPELQLNRAMLEHYIANGDTDHPNQVWFDDVVVSTERIGCSASPPGDDGGLDDGGDDDDDDDDDDDGAGDDGGSSGGAPSGDGPSGDDDDDDDDGVGTGGTGTADGAGLGDETETGCGCRTSDDTPAWLWLSPLLLVVRRRTGRAA